MLLLEGGRVLAYGTREELLASGSDLAHRLLRDSAAANVSLDEVEVTAVEEASATVGAGGGQIPKMDAAGGGGPKEALPVAGVSRLTVAEGKRAGSFSLGLYWTYIQALGRVSASIYIALLFVTYAAYLWFDIWLTRWIRDDEACGSSLGSEPQVPDCGRLFSSSNALIYAALGVGHVTALISTSLFLTAISVRASMSMHRDTICRVLYAPIAWYDSTPSGRVISRFTSDLNTVDVKLSMDIDNLLQMVSAPGIAWRPAKSSEGEPSRNSMAPSK
jgi:ABC-type multidrug transport system fused ATPase/permease subunit